MNDTSSSPGRDSLLKARSTLTDVLAGFTTGQKTLTVLAVIALALGGMTFMRWVATPTLVPLFSDMATSDAAAITAELDTMGVAYELADGGRTILVDRSAQADLRLDMSGAGLLPDAGVGFSILDDNGVTTPEALWDAEYQRAVEGELATTISAMDIVESARVHLVMPSEDLFVQDDQRATASVFLALTAGTTPAPMQIQSVVNLVAGSVEGLTPDQVTVTDTGGNLLHAPGEDGQLAAMGDARQQQTSSFEQRLGSSVERMLQQVVGPEKAVVTVTADLDFDTVAQTQETFGDGGPQGGIPLETSATTETYDGTGAAQAGVLGPDGQVVPGGTGETTTYQMEDGTTRFAVDRTVQEILSAPGSVNRLSVAVLLDAEVDAADAQAVQALVEAAVGFDPVRGDVVQVSALPFDTSAAEAAAEAAAAADAARSGEQMMDLVKTGASLLVVLVVLFLAWRSASKSMALREPKSIPLDLDALEFADEDDEDEDLELALRDEQLRQLQAGPTISDEIADMIDSQGEDMAGLLRGWMAEK